MVDFTKHNALERQAQGAEGWGSSINDNFSLMETGATIKAIAGLTVSAAEVGYLTDDFKFNKAIAAAGGTYSTQWVGFFANDIDQGIEGYARHNGYISNINWNFTPGPVYLSDITAGAVTQTAPTEQYMVGFAIQTNEILIKPYKFPTGGSQIGEGYMTVWPWHHDSVIQGTWVYSMNTAQVCNVQYYNTSSTDGDGVRYKMYLAAGTYSFRLVYAKHTSRGIMEVLIDGIPKGTIDQYAASTLNSIDSLTGLTVATDGIKDVDVVCNGQNVSSTGYVLSLTFMAFWRTA